jgi:hypothetical protein
MSLKSKNLCPSQVKLRPATIEDNAYLYNLAKTVYKKLIIDFYKRLGFVVHDETQNYFYMTYERSRGKPRSIKV